MEFDVGESQSEIDVTFSVNQKLRRVFKLVRKKKGDVYVRIISGVRRGESSTGSPIGEDRISLHPSNSSQAYNTFKKTFSATDGTPDTEVQLNTAVKSRKGFAYLASVMFSDLAATIYDLSPSKIEQALVVGEFDPDRQTGCCALFVGAIGEEFNCGNVPIDILKIDLPPFQIVIVCALVLLPAIPYARTIFSRTLRPDDPFLGRRERARRLQIMQSLSPEECLQTFLNHIPELFSYRYIYLKVAVTETLAALNNSLDGATAEELPSIKEIILDAEILLSEIKPPARYLYVKNGSSAVSYVDEQGKYVPL